MCFLGEPTPLSTTGFGPIYPHDAILRESTQSARVWTDGAPPATFTVTQRTVYALCDREGISAESAGAVASNVFYEFLTT